MTILPLQNSMETIVRALQKPIVEKMLPNKVMLVWLIFF
jgi:hypothetical protein